MSLFVKDIFTTLATRVLVLLLGFFTNVFVANTLGSERLGAYSLVMTTLGGLTLWASLGLEASNVYFAGQNRLTTAALVANSLGLPNYPRRGRSHLAVCGSFGFAADGR